MNVNRLPVEVLRTGSAEPAPEPKKLRAGPVALLLEGADLRRLTCAGREFIQRIYVAVRDENWETIAPRLSDLRVAAEADSFAASFLVSHRRGPVDFRWRGAIEGRPDGTLVFTMDGEAYTTFWRNRIGFCVLHPGKGCAGLPCVVEQVDGSLVRGRFPRHIAPHQPFVGMRAISYEITPGLAAEVRFAGDIFEMEDQRNWCDDSFKTYSTPLSLPYPALVEAGTKISQKIVLTLRGEPNAASDAPARVFIPSSDAELTLDAARPPRPLPRLGLALADDDARPQTPREIERLRALHLSHVRADLHLSVPDDADKFWRATDEAARLGTTIEAALFFSDEAARELKQLSETVRELKPPVSSWLIFQTSQQVTGEPLLKMVVPVLRRLTPGALVGTGTNAYFTEVNRERPAIETVDLLSFSVNPQVHAFDNLSLIENAAALSDVIERARHFAAGRQIVISPLTLKPRFNPVAKFRPVSSEDALPADVDVRQMSLFGAAWTTACLKHACAGGAESVTCYETAGWRGVMEREAGSARPDLFPSPKGAVFPLYHVLRDVGEFAGGEALAVHTTDARLADGLALRRAGRTRLLAANMTLSPQRVVVRNLGEWVAVRPLDESNVIEAMLSPEDFATREGERRPTTGGALALTLPPCGLARIDLI